MDAYLFPLQAEGQGTYSLTTCWRTICANAGLGSLRLHDQRHTAASQAVMAGENLPLVGKLLGHRRHLMPSVSLRLARVLARRRHAGSSR